MKTKDGLEINYKGLGNLKSNHSDDNLHFTVLRTIIDSVKNIGAKLIEENPDLAGHSMQVKKVDSKINNSDTNSAYVHFTVAIYPLVDQKTLQMITKRIGSYSQTILEKKLFGKTLQMSATPSM